ncbi:MAG: GTP 3',8-cyclase MoaA [Porticoccaceae bacterium]
MTSINPLQSPRTRMIDPFNRHIHYLRLSVTDRCNLRCTYCMAEEMKFLPRTEVLSLEEIERLARCFVDLGVDKIRLTGGEPLVRRGIVELSRALSGLDGLRELTMTTNGLLLDQYAQPLRSAGISRLNISIDSLSQDRFKKLTRLGNLNQALQGIEAAVEAGFERIKLNAVILKGVNDDEVLGLADFAISRGLDISFIEEMPLGHIDSHARDQTQVSSQSIRQQLCNYFKLTASTASTGGPSRYFVLPNSKSRIGFISPMSDNFCTSCNRVRLTAEGQLLLCLGNEHSLDLRSMLRNSVISDNDLKAAMLSSIDRKPERHHFSAGETRIVRFMSHTGG